MKNYVMSVIAIASLGAVAFVVSLPAAVSAHCQVPCGIYDDHARIHHMLEDTTTIAKAVTSISELAGKTDPQSVNQVTRWINTKEDHASNIITTIAQYFLTQKVKEVKPGAEGYEDYLNSLATHHHVMRAAMKTKQTVDPKAVEELKSAIDALGKLYPG
jgi:nickel superoxide dismutase